MLCSAVSSALGSLCNKEAAKKMGPVTLCGWQLILGAVLLIGVGFYLEGEFRFWKYLPPAGCCFCI